MSRAGRRVTAYALTAVVLGTASLTSACGGDSYARYCSEVRKQQRGLTVATTGNGRAGLVAALPAFQALAAKAPVDIQDDWATITAPLEALSGALKAAGVDPDTYDAAHPPAGLTTAQKAAIASAAGGLTDPKVATALDDVQQEARDVCHTPLTLG